MNMEKRTVSKKRRRKKNEKNTRVHTNLCCYGNFTFQILSLTLRFLYVNGAFVQRIHKFIVWQCVLFLSFFYCRSTDKYKTFWQSPQVQHTHILSIQGSKKTTKHHILFRNFENWLFSQFITDFDIELLWKFHAFIVYNNYMSSIHVKIVHRCLHIFDIHLRFGRISIVFPFHHFHSNTFTILAHSSDLQSWQANFSVTKCVALRRNAFIITYNFNLHWNSKYSGYVSVI